jgi:hypothetical protein
MAIYQKINTKFSSFLLEQMDQNPDSIYGEGYRKVHRFWQKHQWPGVLNKMNNYK